MSYRGNSSQSELAYVERAAFVKEGLYVEAQGRRDFVDVFTHSFLDYRSLASIIESTGIVIW